jgi:hypothetical protein
MDAESSSLVCEYHDLFDARHKCHEQATHSGYCKRHEPRCQWINVQEERCSTETKFGYCFLHEADIEKKLVLFAHIDGGIEQNDPVARLNLNPFFCFLEDGYKYRKYGFPSFDIQDNDKGSDDLEENRFGPGWSPEDEAMVVANCVAAAYLQRLRMGFDLRTADERPTIKKAE